MPYYLRTFCTTPEIPKLASVLDHAAAQGYPLTLASDQAGMDLGTSNWERVELLCQREGSQFVAELNRDEGTEDCLFRQEVAEFIEMVTDLRFSLGKRTVLRHLRDTRYTAATQVLTSESGEVRVEAANAFLSYFRLHCGGLLQADHEGFYDLDRLILALD